MSPFVTGFVKYIIATFTEHGQNRIRGASRVGIARRMVIAAQIGFLLSDAAATITGTVLVSDGGYTL